MDISAQLGSFYSLLTNPAFYLENITIIGAFLATFIGLRIIKELLAFNLRKLAEKTETKFDDTLVDILDSLGTPFYFTFALYAASQFVQLPAQATLAIHYLLLAVLVYYAVKAVQKLIDFFTNEMIEKRKKEEGEGEDVSIIHLFNSILKAAVWIVAVLIFLSNIGIDITPLLAGASIGGLAIAFALQNVLSDVFASFSIYFDKPFKVGDFIVIGTDKGTVKKIGIKSTRIQTVQGEELIISNRELTESRINNFKRMANRVTTFNFGVVYGTDVSKLEKIPRMVKEIVEKAEHSKLERVHLKKLGDSAIEYEVVYTVKSSDYAVYMNVQQEINLALLKKFQKEKIEFAYPTQTVFLQK